MSTCNYCTFKEIKSRYKGHKIVLKNEDGGTSIYVDGKFIAWLMEITDSCAC